MKREFKILTGTISDLETLVNDALSNYWQLHGCVFVVPTMQVEPIFAQAVTRESMVTIPVVDYLNIY